MIVVDVGAQTWPGFGRYSGVEESTYTLCERFRPEVLFAFDPHPTFGEGIERYGRDPRFERRRRRLGQPPDTVIVRKQIAAWTEDGFVDFHDCGIGSGVGEPGSSAAAVPCFNLVAWLKTLPLEGAILKLDCEGAEYPLLWSIYNNALDLQIAKVLVEWHPGEHPRGDYYGFGWQTQQQAPIRCEVEQWGS